MRKRSQTTARTAPATIIIAKDDHERLAALIYRATSQGQETSSVAALASELRRAQIVPRTLIPHDVVTMNSTVRLRDLEVGEDETYTLVYPHESDVSAGRLSVLAPVGTALLGYRVGDVVEWPVPAGVARFRIEEVLSQPTASRLPAGR